MGVFLRRKSGQQRAQPLRLAQEQQLFLTREPLDGVLHPRRGCEIRRAPQPLERFDGMAAGVFGTFPAAVHLQAVDKVHGRAGVQASVPTPQNINIVSHGPSLLVQYNISFHRTQSTACGLPRSA